MGERTRIRVTDDVVRRWGERIDLVNPERESYSKYSMIGENDSIYHYGRHFELGRILRTRGRARLVLLNGDTWSGSGGFGPSTGSRQSDARREANAHGVQTIVLPYSALEAAGMELNTIQPIHVRADRHTTEHGQSTKRPADLGTMNCPDGRTMIETRYQHVPRESGGGYEWRDVEVEVPVSVPDPNHTTSFRCEHGWCHDGAELGEDGIWRWSWERHWLGDSLFRARVTERRTRKATPEEMEAFEIHLAWERRLRRLEHDARELMRTSWDLDRTRHGRSRFETSSFGGDYRLMTRSMLAAANFRERAERAREIEHEHRLTEPPRVNVRNGRVPITVTRWATFLSSFDYQESRPLYFLCELPHGAKPGTVEEAVAALKPPEVVAAEARGLKVVRQGDLFGIPTKLNRRQLRAMRGRGRDFTKRLRVLGTNHSVTEGVVCKGGAVLGRGIMRHEPDGWREPDHAKQYLGDRETWHLLVRNTVPRQAI